MDNMGIDVQVCCTVLPCLVIGPNRRIPSQYARFLRRLGKTCAEYPQRHRVGYVAMQAPALAVEEVKRCVKDLGLAGFQIGSY